MISPNPPTIRWSVSPSIAMELDLALTAASGYFIPNSLPEEYTNLILNLPSEWLGELPTFLGKEPEFSSLLETSAYLADVLQEGDYSKATIAMRELNLQQAFERIARTGGVGKRSTSASPSTEQFIEAASDALTGILAHVGFTPTETSTRQIQVIAQLKKVVRIMPGGDLHARFWHWLDRFYYQVYQPWRQTRNSVIEMEERQASSSLGGSSGETPPSIDWLPAQNPLQRMPPLRKAIEELGLPVFFWAEPFGMMDSWGLYPDLVTVSFARPGIIFENFRSSAEDVANRTAALADPTRLMILRIIRQFGMDNTEIAAYLGIARPTVSIHAKILREAGLIRSYPRGRSVRHEINPEEVLRLYNDLRRFLDLPTLEQEHQPQTDAIT